MSNPRHSGQGALMPMPLTSTIKKKWRCAVSQVTKPLLDERMNSSDLIFRAGRRKVKAGPCVRYAANLPCAQIAGESMVLPKTTRFPLKSCDRTVAVIAGIMARSYQARGCNVHTARSARFDCLRMGVSVPGL